MTLVELISKCAGLRGFVKSSYSADHTDDCVELSRNDLLYAFRDSKQNQLPATEQPVIIVSCGAGLIFLCEVSRTSGLLELQQRSASLQVTA